MVSDLFLKARKNAKTGCCFVCNKKISTTAKSHNVPQFILREINENGYVSKNFFLNKDINSIFGKNVGIQRASTFRILCDECEHELFKYYESKEKMNALMNSLNQKVLPQGEEIKLASIYLKCVLREIHVKMVADKQITAKILDQQVESGRLSGHNSTEIYELNIKDYEIGMRESLNTIFNKTRDKFYVYYHKVLPYQVRLAAQAVICVRKDFLGNMVNDTTELSNEIRMDDICVVVFPFDKKTNIIIFGLKSGKNRYKEMFKQLNNMTESDKLKAIQSLIFSYTEEIYISPSLYSQMEEDESIKALSIQGVIPTPHIINDTVIFSLNDNNLTGYQEIKRCYLTNKYAKH